MFRFRNQTDYRELSPFELEKLRAAGSALIVDVRSPGEYASEHIEGAVNVPLSQFDPDRLPREEGRMLVLQCRSGGRSRVALDQCRTARSQINVHLAGGIEAWKRAGLPVVRG